MAEEGDLLINGKVYDPNTMTFREQREMRRIIRDEIYAGQDVDEDKLALADITPAMALVFVRRDNPQFTLDEALDLAYAQIHVTAEKAKELSKKAPPTARDAKAGSRCRPSTPATSGPPK